MTEKQNFQCDQCDYQVELDLSAEIPQCCGKTMVRVAEPLKQCTTSGTAEHSRFDDMGEPCDDGRAG